MREAWHCPVCLRSGLAVHKHGAQTADRVAALDRSHKALSPKCPQEALALRSLPDISYEVNSLMPDKAPEIRPTGQAQACSDSERFLAAWNNSPHTIRVASEMNLSNLGDFVKRITDPAWLATYQQALDRMPLKFFAGEKVAVVWFLKEETVTKILAGAYDFVPRDRKQAAETPKAKKPSELFP